MTLEIGQSAPDFELNDQHGQAVRSASFAADKAVVLVFYPYAFSRVCTGELSDLRDRLPTSSPTTCSCWRCPATRCSRCARSATPTT